MLFFHIFSLLLCYDYSLGLIFTLSSAMHPETSANSSQLMNLNITKCPLSRDKANEGKAQKQACSFSADVCCFPMMDTVSEVTRLNAASHCIDSYLKVSRLVIIY